MTSFGKIDGFNPEVEEFSAYLERIELYFVATGISEEKQVPVFLSLLGAKTVGEYLAEFRQLATHCSFDNHLDEALRDRLLYGLMSKNIQKCLLSEEDLDLKRALEIAQGMEAASKNTQML